MFKMSAVGTAFLPSVFGTGGRPEGRPYSHNCFTQSEHAPLFFVVLNIQRYTKRALD